MQKLKRKRILKLRSKKKRKALWESNGEAIFYSRGLSPKKREWIIRVSEAYFKKFREDEYKRTIEIERLEKLKGAYTPI